VVAADNGRDLLANVSGRVHASKDTKVGVSFDGLNFALLSENNGATFEKTADAFKRLWGGQVDFVEQHPIAVPYSFHKRPLYEGERKVILELVLLDL